MSRSIGPMDSLFAGSGTRSGFAPGLIVPMSLQPAIPRRVALQQSPPPLHQPESIVNPPAGTVNHHLPGAGEFSTGGMGNFQPALTFDQKRGYQTQVSDFGTRATMDVP